MAVRGASISSAESYGRAAPAAAAVSDVSTPASSSSMRLRVAARRERTSPSTMR
jgi:hypothetical protein